ncbi:MAG: hypothetical protein AAF431_13580 [Pseudomonadota bacterium]
MVPDVIARLVSFTHCRISVSLVAAVSIAFLAGCAHTANNPVAQISEADWKYEFIHYHDSLAEPISTTAEALLAIDDRMRKDVQSRFGHLGRRQAANALASWIVDDAGLGLQYIHDANLTPTQAYQQKQANCLSYTLLFKRLAAALDIEILVNSVDTPDTWSMEDDTMFFYRHVNGVLRTPTQYQAFDFTPESYDARYPQRTVSEQEALALFFNNRALDEYRKGENSQAMHLIKLAVSLSPDNADVWANLGTILKRDGARARAKEAMEFALLLDSSHVVAASQLERLHREDGNVAAANHYAALGKKTRAGNPYYLYREAKRRVLTHEYTEAKQLVSEAINKHPYDPRFFALRGYIESKSMNFKAAQRNFRKASKLENDSQQKKRYASKAALLGQTAKALRQQAPDRSLFFENSVTPPSILQ